MLFVVCRWLLVVGCCFDDEDDAEEGDAGDDADDVDGRMRMKRNPFKVVFCVDSAVDDEDDADHDEEESRQGGLLSGLCCG